MITHKLDLRKKSTLVHPFISFLYRVILCFLFMRSTGSLKSTSFHILTLFYTCYIAGVRPFRAKFENMVELANRIFMLTLTCMILIVFSGMFDSRVNYTQGFVVAGFICFAVLINVLAIIWYILKKLRLKFMKLNF